MIFVLAIILYFLLGTFTLGLYVRIYREKEVYTDTIPYSLILLWPLIVLLSLVFIPIYKLAKGKK